MACRRRQSHSRQGLLSLKSVSDGCSFTDSSHSPAPSSLLLFSRRRYGYTSSSLSGSSSSFACLTTGELVYFVAGVVVVWDVVNDTQRFYCEHLRDVTGCVSPVACVSPCKLISSRHRLCVFEGRTVASMEERYSSERESSICVRIWTPATLVTEASFEESLGDQKLVGALFAPNVRSSCT